MDSLQDYLIILKNIILAESEIAYIITGVLLLVDFIRAAFACGTLLY